MTKKEINNTTLSVLNAYANKYDGSDDLVDYTTYLTRALTSVIKTPEVNGELTWDEAKLMLRPFLWMKYIALGLPLDKSMWEHIAMNGDEDMFEAFHDLKEVCKQ